MKTILLLALIISYPVFSLNVTKSNYIQETSQIQLELQYSGGCFEHDFRFRVENCTASKGSNNCDGKVVDLSKKDLCQGWITVDRIFSLASISAERTPMKITFESGNVLLITPTAARLTE